MQTESMKNLHACQDKFCKKGKLDYKAISLNKDNNLVITKIPKQKGNYLKQTDQDTRTIEFPKVFNEDKSTKKIYQEVLDSRVDKSFDGLSFTLITYGISGSGKTHTTFGS
jgi:hypothetical protein